MSGPDRTEHERWSGDAAAYVLKALDAVEREQFEVHLRECARCRDEVAHLKVVADTLPAAAPPVAPPPALKDRIMATVRAEAELLQAAGPDADRGRPRGRRWRRPGRGWSGLTLGLASAAAATVLVAVGVAVGGLSFGGGGHARTVAAQVNASALPGAHAFVRRSGSATQLEVAGLPAAPRGRIWQIWIKRPDRPPQRNARFELRNGSIDVPGNLGGTNLLMVTAESITHVSDVPTGPVVIRAQLV
jgi:BMFP domain-containing protein YqiC